MVFFKFVKIFEKILVFVLILLMAVVVLAAIGNLVLKIYQSLVHPPMMLLNTEQLMEIFGIFLIVFIGIELLESIRTYVIEKTIHVELVLLVSIMAIARKVIVLDLTHTNELSLMGIAAIALALSIGYYLVKKSHKEMGGPDTSRFHRKPE